MTLVRRLAAAVALVLIGVAGALVVVVSTIDLNAYRDDIAAETERFTGRALTIAGDIEAELLSLRPALVAHQVSLANAPWGTRPAMARLDRLELQLDLVALLGGRLAVDRLVAVAPDILLETDEEGRGNWIFARPSAAATREAGGAAPPTFGEMRIEAARLTYRDGATGRETAVRLGHLSLRALTATGPMALQAAGAIAGHKVTVTGTLGPLADLIAGRAYPVAFEARFGGSDLDGRLEIDLAGAPPAVKGSLTAERIDGREVALALGVGRAGPAAAGADERLFGDEALPFAALRAIDADLKVAIKRLDLGATPVADLDLGLALAGGRLSLAPIAAKAGGGTLRGEIRADARPSPSRLAVTLEARGLALAMLGRELIGAAPATAPLNVDLRLEGAGATPHAIAATLGGRVTIIAGRGTIDDALFGHLSADLLKAITPWAPREDAPGLVCLVGDFAVADGVARGRVLLVDTTRAAIVGRRGGTFDLGRERMDLLLDPYTRGLSAASAVAAPIRIQGPLARPEVFPDPGAALEGVVLAPFNLAGKAADGVLGAVGDVAGAVGSVVGLGGGEAEAPAGPCPEALAAVAAGSDWPGEGGSAAAAGGGVTGAVGSAGKAAGGVVEGVGKAAGDAVEGIGRGVGGVLKGVGEGIGGIFKK